MRRLTALVVAALVLGPMPALAEGGLNDAPPRPPPAAAPRVDDTTVVAVAHAPALAVRRVRGKPPPRRR